MQKKPLHQPLRRFMRYGAALLLGTSMALGVQPTLAQGEMFPFVGMGDSIGAGVQSGDANFATQPHSYLNLMAQQMGLDFTLPWIASDPFGAVGDTSNRSRILPDLPGANLAVSGATVGSLLNFAANATTTAEIDTETDLILFPRLGSQMQVVENLDSGFIVCWIGNNNALGAATSFSQLDGSQLTSIADFQAQFAELARRLETLGRPVIFGNIPDVTDIAFLIDAQDLVRLTGSDQGLPPGHFTSVIAMLLLKAGLADSSLLQDPNYVLDPTEVSAIRQRIDAFNTIIQNEAGFIGMPVVDVNGRFKQAAQNPIVMQGVPLTADYLGGLFSLDGIHPSNIGHAILANAFLETSNLNFGTTFPLLDQADLLQIFATDPFVDKDGDGVVTGRPWVGLLETLAFLLGVSGDSDDGNAAVGSPLQTGGVAQARAAGSALVTREDIEQAFGKILSPAHQ